jgi:hypothetical protein
MSEEVQKEFLSDSDRMALEMSKLKKQVATANAEKALAQNETAELAYRHVFLQICMKYGLTAADTLHEDGSFVRGGAVVKEEKASEDV